MTKVQFSEIVGTLLGYTDSDIRVHQQDVFFTGDLLRGTLIEQYVKENGTGTIGSFCKPMVYPVQYDVVRKKDYIDLGGQILGLRDNMGILSVGLTAEDEESFVMQGAGMGAVYAGLEAGNALGRKICYKEGNRIYFKYLEPEQVDILVIAVPTLFAILDEDEELPQPYEFNAKMTSVTMDVLQGQKMFPEDKDNDGRAVAPPNR